MKHVEVYLSPELRDSDRKRAVATLYPALEGIDIPRRVLPQSSPDCDYVFELEDGKAIRAVERINQYRGFCAKAVDLSSPAS